MCCSNTSVKKLFQEQHKSVKVGGTNKKELEENFLTYYVNWLVRRLTQRGRSTSSNDYLWGGFFYFNFKMDSIIKQVSNTNTDNKKYRYQKEIRHKYNRIKC